tara:strand:+ start:47731 stop:49419 length:1689 start_codon:yes stop_codon:yes gene_type:complete
MAQSPSESLLNSLEYEELLTLFNDFEGDSLAQEKIARTYLERAKVDGDTVKVARGYDRLARIFHPQKNLLYADSLIAYTKDWEHITYPGLGYIIKGYEYFLLDDIRNEFLNNKIAYEQSIRSKNLIHQVFLLDNLSKARVEWGSASKALELQILRHKILTSKEFYKNFRESTRKEIRNNLKYLYSKEIIDSYRNFVIIYSKIEDYILAKKYLDSINLELKDFKGWDYNYYKNWYLDAKMETSFYTNNFNYCVFLADSILKNEIAHFRSNYFVKNAYVYKGLALSKINKNYNGIKFLLMADSIYSYKNINSSLKSDILLFTNLNSFYKEQKNHKNQIKYLDKLLYLDSISMVNYQFIEPEIIKSFDTPVLLQEKEAAILQLQQENSLSKRYLILGGGLLLFLLALSALLYRQKILFKKRFKALLQNNPQETPAAGPSISEEIIEDILQKLKKFEAGAHFKNPEVSLNFLAKKFGTNSTYLSKVLNVYKEKNLSQYLNDLRVAYAIEQIKEDSNFRKYSIEAIAKECGYRNATSFSRAFYKKTGIYPSFFVNEWNKQLNERSLS